MWTEDEAMDLALSFQQKAGCDELWSKICDVRLVGSLLHVTLLTLVLLAISGPSLYSLHVH